MCHSEKTHLWGCRDPWGQQRRGILLGQEERERTFSCQGKKGRGGRQRTMGRRHRLYGKSTLHSPCSSKAGMRWCQTRSFWRCSVPFSPNALIFEIVLNLLFLRLWDWVASSNPKEGNWESGRSQTAGHGPGRAALGFLAGRVGKSGLGPRGGQKREVRRRLLWGGGWLHSALSTWSGGRWWWTRSGRWHRGCCGRRCSC